MPNSEQKSAERGAPRRPREKAFDELELAEVGHGRAIIGSRTPRNAAQPREHPVRRRRSDLQ
jgi:hypothetical protein